MKTCILTIGTLGDVVPYIALGRGLKETGFEVTIATLTEFGPVIQKHGLQHAALRGDFLKAAQEAQIMSSGSPRQNPFQLIRQYTEMAKDTLQDQWESARSTEVFIYNPAAIGVEHIVEKLGVPAFAAFPAPLYSPTKEFPSPFFPFHNLGPFNRLSHRLFANLGTAIYRKPVNTWRRDVLGLPAAKNKKHGRPLLKLCAYSEAVVPRPADWDESSVVTGYWFLDAPQDWQPDEALVNFLQNGPKPVYVGFGSMSMFGGIDMTSILIDALKLTGQRAVLLGSRSDTSLASEGIIYVKDVPHDWLFPQMAAVVHHGGAGTTGASLRAGKPMVVCPFVGDQTFWGRRVAALGVGPAPIPRGKLTAVSLADAIQKVLNDGEMHEHAAALGEIIRAEDGVGKAVALINNRLQAA
jgi:UDP:flavonoid glycosyltransferase YjiC (YdhE family)